MFIQKKQAIKRLTCICLSLTSMMLPLGSQAMDNFSEDGADHPINGGYIPLARLGKNIANELEGPNLIGRNSKIFKDFEDEVQKDLKKAPQDSKSLKKAGKDAAKEAAKDAARNAAYSLLKNTNEAELIVKSIMKGDGLEEKKDPREARLTHLAQNHAMNAARMAAEKAAFSILKDEEEALKVVHSLKLDKYAKRENPEGREAAKPSVAPKFKTLQNLKSNEKEALRKQMIHSHSKQTQTVTKLVINAVKRNFKITNFIKKLIK